MNKNTLRYTIIEAVKEVLGHDVSLPTFYSTKLKDGTRVYRMSGTGWGPGTLFKRDGKIWIRPNLGDPNAALVHVTREIAEGDYQRDDLRFWRWEWRLLDKGPEVVEQELDKFIHARGVYNVKVEVGGGDSGYHTSIAFKVLNSNRKTGPPPELALLFSSLPPAGEPWPAERRRRWFETAERMFDLMYGPS
jgi:hypothetical protein